MTSERPRALITGAARRVGAAIGLELARAGCDVAFTYRESAEEAQSTATRLRAAGATVETHRLDLNDLATLEHWGAERAAHWDRLDVLVHNASVYEPGSLEEITEDDALKHYRVNALAPLLLSKSLAPLMTHTAQLADASPCIVALCDMHAMGRPRRNFAAYSMSKAALVEMVRVLARELAPAVRVNGVAPGVVAFPESGFESDPEMQRRYLARVPLGREGTPEDAAQAVRWLGLEARYVTGEIIRVDGGRWLA